MLEELVQALERSPVIAAIFDSSDLEAALQSPCEVIFLLSGSICELRELIEKTHGRGKQLYIHMDLLEGVSGDRSGIRYLKDEFSPDGIITTRAAVARHAKEAGMFVIQRFFLFDSKSFETAAKTLRGGEADAIEILPGILPDIICQLSKESKTLLIAGGLIRTKKNATDSLSAGAMGVSTSCRKIWEM
jgi:glycerol uptake operon antiterminator